MKKDSVWEFFKALLHLQMAQKQQTSLKLSDLSLTWC